MGERYKVAMFVFLPVLVLVGLHMLPGNLDIVLIIQLLTYFFQFLQIIVITKMSQRPFSWARRITVIEYGWVVHVHGDALFLEVVLFCNLPDVVEWAY